MKAIAVKTNDVRAMWPKVSHHFEKIIEDNPTYATLEYIYSSLLDGSYTLLCIVDGDSVRMAMVCEVVTCPTDSHILMIPHLAGVDMPKWIDILVGTLYRLAESLDCAEVMISGGRMGWVKEMKKHGGKLSHVTVTFNVKENIGNYHG